MVSICAPGQDCLTDHDQKANFLYESFKSRLGTSEFTDINFQMNNFLTAHNLEMLDEAFSSEEIESVIRTIPNNHAPGPDGFNGMFIKKCWHIIKNDFLRLFSEFGNGTLDISHKQFSYSLDP